MVSESLLWHFLSSLMFISVTPFSTSLPPSQQPPQPFAIEPPTSPSRRPWVPDLQPPSLRSFTLHRPLSFASPLQTLLQLRFWRYHRDCLAPIYKIVKASTPSETARASTRFTHLLTSSTSTFSCTVADVTYLRQPLTSSFDSGYLTEHWLWLLTFLQGWLFLSRFFLSSFSCRFHFCSLFLHIVSLDG